MRKSILLAAFLCTTTFNALAMPAGFNFGVGAGAALTEGNIRYGDADPTQTVGIIVQSGKVGFNAIFLVGYNMSMNKDFDVDIQFDGQLNGGTARPFHLTQTTVPGGVVSTFRVSERNKSSFGLSARPTLKVNDSANMFFVVGYRQGKFNNKMYETDGATGRSVRRSQNNTRRGMEYGLGFEMTLTQTTSLRFEIDQTRYKMKNVLRRSGTQNMDTSSETRVNHGLVSLVWHYDS